MTMQELMHSSWWSNARNATTVITTPAAGYAAHLVHGA
jgi:hypothetical protein